MCEKSIFRLFSGYRQNLREKCMRGEYGELRGTARAGAEKAG